MHACAPAPPPTPLNISNARILAADDDATTLRVLERILSRAGYTEVRTTHNGDAVPELFVEHQPDLVLLDLHMGHVEGTDVIRRLRPLIPAGEYLPMLIVSGDATDEARLGAMEAGAADYIRKPFSAAEVLLRVRNHLHMRTLHLTVARLTQELEQLRSD